MVMAGGRWRTVCSGPRTTDRGLESRGGRWASGPHTGYRGPGDQGPGTVGWGPQTGDRGPGDHGLVTLGTTDRGPGCPPQGTMGSSAGLCRISMTKVILHAG